MRRAEVIIPIESIESDSALGIRQLRRWFERARRYRSDALPAVGDTASIVLDERAFTLHVGGEDVAGEVMGTHDGAEFSALAQERGVDVYLTNGVDTRRAKPADLDAAAADGRVLAGSVAAFVVHTL